MERRRKQVGLENEWRRRRTKRRNNEDKNKLQGRANTKMQDLAISQQCC
jgi:hypothetical protein